MGSGWGTAADGSPEGERNGSRQRTPQQRGARLSSKRVQLFTRPGACHTQRQRRLTRRNLEHEREMTTTAALVVHEPSGVGEAIRRKIELQSVRGLADGSEAPRHERPYERHVRGTLIGGNRGQVARNRFEALARWFGRRRRQARLG